VPKPVEGTKTYLPGLDGLRALAVAAVVAYHLHLSFAKGGLLGVQVFFVLSGYLITDLLVRADGHLITVKMQGFWIRRARRLLPALLVMLLAVIIYSAFFYKTELETVRSDLLPALLYYSNWYFIYHHVSYFARFGPPSPLGNLWSLAVEEQFYLLWPLTLLIATRFTKSRKVLALTCALLAIASAAEMAVLYKPGLNPNRVYMGTDTRAFALLIGSALALVLPRHNLKRLVPTRYLEALGLIGLWIIISMFVGVNQYQTFNYEGGMFLLALASALVTLLAAIPTSLVSRILGTRPAAWIGERSYGIYLWHYPVIILTTPLYASFSWIRVLLQIAATLAIASLSWKYIEQPIRTLGFRSAVKNLSEWLSENPRTPKLSVATLLVVSLTAATSVGIAEKVKVPITQAKLAVLPRTAAIGSSSYNSYSGQRYFHPYAPQRPIPLLTTPRPGTGITAIGDSIMVDASPYLKQLLPGIQIYAKVGEQLWQAQQEVSQLKNEGVIGQTVIIELGTNGYYTPAQLIAFIDSLGPPKHIVLVNTRVPRPWQDSVNNTISQVAATMNNVVVVNWYSISATHLNFFEPDGVHLDPQGARFYAELLAKAAT
jgi:peptidoglycan/LPS O-acetylase OafA/YrhL/lysophospholipase L1-like esterase